jgi:hypothetical protein
MAIVKKITTGFVTQTFDTDTKKFTGQSFVAIAGRGPGGVQVVFEDDLGDLVSPITECLSFDMKQPGEITRQDVEEQREQCQEDLMCVLDGAGDRVLELVCQVIVDRFNILLTKLG